MFIFYPQWQSGAPSDALYHGAHVVRGALERNPNIEFTSIEIEQKQPIDPRNEQTPKSIRQSSALTQNHKAVHDLLNQRRPSATFTLGGDCGIDLSLISWLNTTRPNDFAVIWFDAHPDMNSIFTSPSGRFDGMVLRHLIDGLDIEQKPSFPPLQPEQVILAGNRCFDEAETQFIAEKGLTLISCEDLTARGAEILIEALQRQGYRRCYIHIDTDVIDPSDFPYGTSMEPDGVSMQTLLDIIHGLRSSDDVEILGGSLAEITADIQNHPVIEEGMCRLFLALAGHET